MAQAGIAALFTDYWQTPRVDKHGNEYVYEGRALLNRAGGKTKNRRMFDVSFVTAGPGR